VILDHGTEHTAKVRRYIRRGGSIPVYPGPRSSFWKGF
jgi:hypothetical protein